MYATASFIGLSFLSIVGAVSTVTVSINTGECPATYMSSSASSSSGSSSSLSSPSSVHASVSTGISSMSGMISAAPTDTAAATSTTANGAAASGGAAPCPCPADNNQTVYDSLSYDYQVTCGESFSLLQGPGSSFAATFDDCMLACDAYVDETTYDACTAAAYMPGDPENGLNCFLTTDADPTMTPESGTCIAMVPSGEQ